MNILEKTLDQLDAVAEAAMDPCAAYLIRSRLRRALLSCARAIAELQGLEKPILPGQWTASPTSSPQIHEVAALCRRIHQNSEYLCQPSESFDIRWEEGWGVLKADLDRLRALLETLPASKAMALAN